MLDHNLLKNARGAIQKVAFNPMTEEAQMAAAQQGAAPPPPGAGGAPPMDPAMMGGAPQMDPAMMGGAPPMDPAMMGMDPSMMGMDPSMMGGAPPMDPAMMGMDPAMMGGAPPMEDPGMGGTPVQLNLEDLQQIVKELGDGGEAGGEEEPKRATNKQIMERLDLVGEQLSALAAAMGIQLPAGEVGTGGDTSTEPDMSSPDDLAAAAATEEMTAEATGGAAAPGGADPLAGDPAFDALAQGLPPGEGMPKMAATNWLASTKLGG